MISTSRGISLSSNCRTSSRVFGVLVAFGLLVLSMGSATVSHAVPAIVENDYAATLMNTPVVLSLLENDLGNWMSGSLEQPANGTFVFLTNTTLEYTPNTDFTPPFPNRLSPLLHQL